MARRPTIGEMDRRVTIQSVSTSADAYGEEVETWTDDDTVWADVREETGREAIRAGRVEARQTVLVTIRHRTGITTHDRLKYEGDVLHIVRPPREIGRRQFLEIACSRKV